MKRSSLVITLCALICLSLILSYPLPGKAAEEVVIGALYPLTGPVAQAGVDSKNAIELAVDIINNTYDLNMPLAKTAGLPNLGGAKVRVIFTDHQGSPEKGLAEAERLITQEKVVALYGAFHSAVTATASQVAERYGIPYLTGESSSPTLHRRGFKWFFRTSLHDEHFSKAMFDFLKDLEKKKGIKIETVGLLYEDTLFGKDSGRVEREFAEQYGYKVVEDIQYRSRTSTLTAEIQRMKAADPDVFFPTSYINDALLMVRTMRELDYNPKLIIAQDSGHNDAAFIQQAGKEAEGLASRSAFAPDLIERNPMLKTVNAMFHKRAGRDFSDASVRSFMGLIVLADAINRAGSTEPEAIRKALLETDIPGEQLIVPWRGVKFDPATGQNELGNAIIMQLQGGQYYTVWPFEKASREVIYPIPKWSEKQ